MFAVTLCAGLLSLTTHVVQGKCIETPQVPDGITVHKIISTWEEADLQCKSEDAVLASPINTELLNAMKTLISFNNAQYFIGTRSSHYPGPFVSVEGVSLDEMTSAVLKMVQQLDPRDGDCLSMDERSIRVVPCCMRLPFICYKAKMETLNTTAHLLIDSRALDSVTELATEEQTKSATKSASKLDIELLSDETTESTTESWSKLDAMHHVRAESTMQAFPIMSENSQEYPCKTNDTEYKYFNKTGSCYKKHTQKKIWDEASAACEAENAHLLVIDDNTELQVFKRMDLKDVGYFAFIGLRDYNSDGVWKTVTGKLMSEIFIEWYSDGPAHGDLRCAAIYSTGVLDNHHCDSATSFICEKEIT